MDSTPYKPPPFPTGTSLRPRRQLYTIEDIELHEEMVAILTVALTDPTRAGILMNDIATRQLLPSPNQTVAATPTRSQLRARPRFTPYNTERRTTRQNPAPSMFDSRNLQHVSPPITPQRQNEHYPPASHSRSLDYATPSRPSEPRASSSVIAASHYRPTANTTPTVTPLRQTQHPYPGILSRVRNLPDFEHIRGLRLIRSETSAVGLSSPRHCIFDERRREWIVADKDRGILFLNKDCFQVLRSIPDFYDACAVVLLNSGNHLGVLDKRGIFIYDISADQKRSIFPFEGCRGLAVTGSGDFVTLSPKHRCIFLVPQNGDEPSCFPYLPLSLSNSEGEPSYACSVNTSMDRLVVVDYAIGAFTLFEINSHTRDLKLILHQDCTQGVSGCRLTGGFMDQKGRIIVSNSLERLCLLFDHDGKFIQRIPCEGGFARAEYICVNKDLQAVVLESHSARLYRIVDDPGALVLDDLPLSMHPVPVYPKEPPTSSSSDEYPPPYQPPQAHYLEEGEIENRLANCKGLIAEITLDDDNGRMIKEVTLDQDEKMVEEVTLDD